MRNFLIYLILIISFLISCNPSNKNERGNQTLLQPEDNIKVIIDSFIQFSNRH
jgi:hypothetical protein